MTPLHRRIAAKWLFRLSLAAYAGSFFLPTFYITVEGKPSPPDFGYTAFLVCFPISNLAAFLGPLPAIVWLANPALWSSAILVKTGRAGVARIVSAGATLLALPFCFGSEVLAGYYVWLASMVLMLGASIALPPADQTQASAPAAPIGE
jgi:hypothetical protein